MFQSVSPWRTKQIRVVSLIINPPNKAKNVNRTIAPATAPTAGGHAPPCLHGDILCDNCRPFCRPFYHRFCHRFAGAARVAIIFPRRILAFSAEKMSAVALFVSDHCRQPRISPCMPCSSYRA
jgi:hypothetical protein